MPLIPLPIDKLRKLSGLERKRALLRAQQLWGDTAWVMNQSDLHTKMFIVSAGKHPSIRRYGEGESWDEAFVAAGESLFPDQLVEYTEEQRDRDHGRNWADPII